MHFVIIGAGPAGEAAAKTLRKLSAKAKVQIPNSEEGSDQLKITLIERDEPGGLCLNRGCIPSKTLLEHIHKSLISKKPVDWNELQNTKSAVITNIRNFLNTSLKTSKIGLLKGTASFSGENTIKVSGNDEVEIQFDKALITTGNEILYPPPLDQFKGQLLTSDTILELTKTPESILIVGGGAIGLEFACLLNACGTKVTVVELQKTILPGEDPFVVSTLARSFQARNIDIKTETKVSDLEKTKHGWKATLSSGEIIETKEVLACVGRTPSSQSLNPSQAGIELEKNRIVINNQMQTSNPNIYAAGDVVTTRLAHAAAHQAIAAAYNMLGEKKEFNESLVPRALYSWPEVASVGEWKYQREEKGLPVKAARAFFKANAKAIASGETEGFVQIVSDPETKKVLGAQILGAHATELIHTVAAAIQSGFTTDDLGEMIFAHPTLSELIKEAALK